MKLNELDARWHPNEPTCKNCTHKRGDHKAMTLACPLGKKSRMNQVYSKDSKFEQEEVSHEISKNI